jgi:hypothetical protein
VQDEWAEAAVEAGEGAREEEEWDVEPREQRRGGREGDGGEISREGVVGECAAYGRDDHHEEEKRADNEVARIGVVEGKDDGVVY